MEDKVYLIYDNNNAEIDFPIDYDDLFECFKTKFNVDGEKEEYIFKTKDENGDEEIIDDKVEIEYFKKDMKIYVTKKLDEEKNFSMLTSQFEPNKNEYNNIIEKNKNKTKELSDIKIKNTNLKNELKKLKEELENIKKKPKKKKFNVTNYEIEIKRLTDKYENEKNKLEEEISQLKKTNKQKQNEL